MGSLFEILYDVLFQPKAAMLSIADERKIEQAALVFVLSLLIPLWALYFGLQEAGMPAMIQWAAGVRIVGSLLMWFMSTAVWHLIAEFFGGRGTGLRLFTTLGFAYFPQVFIVPLWGFAALVPVEFKTAVMAIAALLIFGWSLFLTVTAIKAVYQFSTAKATLVMIMPLLVMALVGVIAFVFIGSAVTQLPMWL